MMFVEFHDKAMHEDDRNHVISNWKEALLTGMVRAQAYTLEEGTALFTMRKEHVDSARSYLLSQPEVEKVRVNDKDYYPDADEL
mmetsp:Transcript_3165/g.9059  ORF Transcript_3165/g.9059 Transcript_3165/m.9059 type:complete len:84 (-) Transcript_3165:201-452(-)